MGCPKNHYGKRYGLLKVIERSENDKNGKTKWLCLCDCGNEIIVRGQELTRQETTSCGCYRDMLNHMQVGYTTRTKDVIGCQHGDFKIVEECILKYTKQNGQIVIGKCEHGKRMYFRKKDIFDSSRKKPKCDCAK